MRTYTNARKLRLNLCQLNAMTDSELTEALRVANIKSNVVIDGTNNTPWCNTDTVIDIRKSWSVASKADRGIAVK